jgi:hypothetical protein
MKRRANPKRVRKRKPPPQPKPGRADLPLHQQLGVTQAQERAAAERIQAPIRQWWRSSNLDHVLDSVSLAKGLRDLGLVSVKVLLAELTNPKCPIEIRRHIAMTMAPKLAVEVRAAIAQQVAEQQQQSPVPPGQQTIDLSDLLADLERRAPPPPLLTNGGGDDGSGLQ